MKFGEHEITHVYVLRPSTGGQDCVSFVCEGPAAYLTQTQDQRVDFNVYTASGYALEWLFKFCPDLDVPVTLDDCQNGIYVISNLRLVREVTKK